MATRSVSRKLPATIDNIAYQAARCETMAGLVCISDELEAIVLSKDQIGYLGHILRSEVHELVEMIGRHQAEVRS